MKRQSRFESGLRFRFASTCANTRRPNEKKKLFAQFKLSLLISRIILYFNTRASLNHNSNLALITQSSMNRFYNAVGHHA